jgi:phage terminase Nu1 subunit (DNA packaging protein)
VDAQVVQRHFDVSRATVHNWVHTEGCPHAKRGKVLRFQLSAVCEWYANRGAS